MITQKSSTIPPHPSPYWLGRESSESKRLSEQHEVLIKAAGGYFPTQLSLNLEKLEAILDVGTGNAQWLLGLRQSGLLSPSVELCGIDVSNDMIPNSKLIREFGLTIKIKDLSSPLPINWIKKFDYIHIRHVLIWIEPKNWPCILQNLTNALKPGGTLLIIYPGAVPYDSKTDKPLGLNTAPGKLFSAFLKHTASCGLPRHAVTTLPKILLQVGLDPSWILNTTKPINMGGAEPDLRLRSASAHHLDFLLKLLKNLSYSKNLGCPPSDDEKGWKQLAQEWHCAIDRGCYYNLHILSTRKPLN
ncbi:hypothetical protein O181_100207 [Austropuccinia psidii MF-1]|uniref:Methyltransferase domain-containing protein n=1 Tax=Austropuccinia psidii MF-1 TaxID=1389203 RepID=A0A9Q3JES4_9BASI|nr:hypothetical protein [Austropuccinia psidii MF-1]